MSRLEYFRDRLAKSDFYKNLARRIGETQFDEVVSFIEDNDGLDHKAFEDKIIRLGLDEGLQGKARRDNSIKQDLLLLANCALLQIKNRTR